jgi:hypothetical protein
MNVERRHGRNECSPGCRPRNDLRTLNASESCA